MFQKFNVDPYRPQGVVSLPKNGHVSRYNVKQIDHVHPIYLYQKVEHHHAVRVEYIMNVKTSFKYKTKHGGTVNILCQFQ